MLWVKWLGVFFTSRFGIFIVHIFSEKLSESFPPLSTKLYTLTFSDKICVLVNTVIETIFTLWLLNYKCPIISYYFPVNLILIFILDDLLYAPFHHLLHSKCIYKWIHHRHHKISHPYKSYVHASMEHPLEMIGALILHACSISILGFLIDKTCILTHILVKALGACLNHSGRNVELYFYKTKHHHIHHVYRKYNFSQYVFIYDKVFSSYKSTLYI